MKKHRFLSLFLALTCLMSVVFFTTEDSDAATGWDPFALSSFLPSNMVLDPTDPLHGATMLLLDPANYLALLETYARCSNPGNPGLYGITVGTMYCIKSYIKVATHTYSTGLNNTNNIVVPFLGIPFNFFVKLYQSCCFLCAAVLFGARVMTMQSQSLRKDTFSFLMRVAIAMFLITQAPLLFDTFCDIVGEGVGWVTASLGLLTPPTSCWPLIPAQFALQTVDSAVGAPGGYDEYMPWHLIDCMFLTIFGAGPPSPQSLGIITTTGTNLGILNYLDIGQNKLVYSSALPIIGGALFTSTLGVAFALIGIGGLVTILELIMKAMYIVLTAYLAMSLFCLLCPFMAPLLVFESHRNDSFTMGVFKRWAFIILSAIIQPIVILGYLTFCAVLLSAFIAGDQSTDPAISSLFSSCNPDVADDNLCSFHQLFKPFPDYTTFGIPTPVGDYGYMTEINPVLGHWKILGDPQMASANCAMIDRAKTYIRQTAVEQANQVQAKASGGNIYAPSRLKTPNLRIMKGSLTLVSLEMTAFVLMSLMEQIVALAASLSGGVAINMWTGAVPFIGLIRSVLKGAEDGAKSAGKSGLMSGGLQGLKNLPNAFGKSFEGAIDGLGKSLTGRR